MELSVTFEASGIELNSYTTIGVAFLSTMAQHSFTTFQ